MKTRSFHADNLSELGTCSHAFWGRRGGLSKDSKGRPDDLNMGFLHAEDSNEVMANRSQAMMALSASKPLLVTPKQVHSSIVHIVREPWDNLAAPDGDAVVTSKTGLAMGILTADCGPLLFCDPVNKVIGATHAGWRGAEAGIAQRTVEAMESLGAERSSIIVALGPCIAQASYEVGPEFPTVFLEKDPSNGDLFIPSLKADHWMFDLKEFIRRDLEQLKLGSIEIMAEDTCADDPAFFSHRYNTLHKLPEFGRQLSVICLNENIS
jgi:polyphenol oxidase